MNDVFIAINMNKVVIFTSASWLVPYDDLPIWFLRSKLGTSRKTKETWRRFLFHNLLFGTLKTQNNNKYGDYGRLFSMHDIDIILIYLEQSEYAVLGPRNAGQWNGSNYAKFKSMFCSAIR